MIFIYAYDRAGSWRRRLASDESIRVYNVTDMIDKLVKVTKNHPRGNYLTLDGYYVRENYFSVGARGDKAGLFSLQLDPANGRLKGPAGDLLKQLSGRFHMVRLYSNGSFTFVNFDLQFAIGKCLAPVRINTVKNGKHWLIQMPSEKTKKRQPRRLTGEAELQTGQLAERLRQLEAR